MFGFNEIVHNAYCFLRQKLYYSYYFKTPYRNIPGNRCNFNVYVNVKIKMYFNVSHVRSFFYDLYVTLPHSTPKIIPTYGKRVVYLHLELRKTIFIDL